MVAEAANKNTGDCLEVRFPGQQEAGGKAVKAPKSMGKNGASGGFCLLPSWELKGPVGHEFSGANC